MAIVRLQLLDALLMHLRDWAVIAGEYYDQHRTGRVIGETTDFPSTPGKEKSGAGEPKVRIGWVVCPQAAAASSNEKINRYIRFQPHPGVRERAAFMLTRCHHLLRLRSHRKLT